MMPRTWLRLVAFVPGLFACAGAAMIWMYWHYRAYVSPTRGMAVWVVVFLVTSAAVAQLWRGARHSPRLTALSGVGFLTAVLAWPWLSGVADMVNATGSDDPPSFLFEHAYTIALVAIVVLILAAWLIARRAVRSLAE